MYHFNAWPEFGVVKKTSSLRGLYLADRWEKVVNFFNAIGMAVDKVGFGDILNLMTVDEPSKMAEKIWKRQGKKIPSAPKGPKLFHALLEHSNVSASMKGKLSKCSLLEAVVNKVGVRPMIVVFGSKDEIPNIEKFTKFVDQLVVRLLLFGIGVTTGLGPNVMSFFPQRFMYYRPVVEEAMKKGKIKPVWRHPTPAAGVCIGLGDEPLHDYYDAGLIAGPFRNLENRGEALLSIGVVVSAVAFLGGDSTVLEIMQTIVAGKERHQAALDTIIKGELPLILVDDDVHPDLKGTTEDRLMWEKFLEMYVCLSNSRIGARRERKLQQLEKLKRGYVPLNGGCMKQAASFCFDRMLNACVQHYGANPYPYWVELNKINTQLPKIVDAIIEWKPIPR